MRTTIAAVTALAGSLLLAPLMLGPTQAGSAPDLKNAASAIHDSAIILVGHGGGGGGGGGGHMGGGGFGGGHAAFSGGGGRAAFSGHMGGGGMMRSGRTWSAGPGFASSRVAGREFGRGNGRLANNGNLRAWNGHSHGNWQAWNGHNHNHHFHNRRFFANNVFIGGYPYYDDYYYGYGGCYWLRRQAVITGSRYWWNRYQACYGYY